MSGPVTVVARPRALLFALVASACALVIALLAAEFATRHFLHVPPPAPPDERTLLYRFDSSLGWFPVPASVGTYTGSRRITVRHNALGFRDREHGPKRKPRIAFVGDSFVWGYDVDEGERFTERLQATLPDLEVLNLGISGFGTDQEFLLLEKVFDALRPDLVVLVFCAENDRNDNSSSYRYGYFKPYFEVDGRRLKLKGIPVPMSLRYYQHEWPTLFGLIDRSSFLTKLTDVAGARFLPAPLHVPDPTFAIIRQMKALSDAHQVRLVCGITAPRPDLDAGFQQAQVPCVDLSTDLRYPGEGHHWTPEGHAWVSDRLGAFLAPFILAIGTG